MDKSVGPLGPVPVCKFCWRKQNWMNWMNELFWWSGVVPKRPSEMEAEHHAAARRWRWRRRRRRRRGCGSSGGGVGGSGSSLKDGDLSSMASAVTPSSQSGNDHQAPHRVSASLGELTPPGSAGIHSAVSNEDASSNLVFSDLYWSSPTSIFLSISISLSLSLSFSLFLSLSFSLSVYLSLYLSRSLTFFLSLKSHMWYHMTSFVEAEEEK